MISLHIIIETYNNYEVMDQSVFINGEPKMRDGRFFMLWKHSFDWYLGNKSMAVALS